MLGMEKGGGVEKVLKSLVSRDAEAGGGVEG